MSTIGFNPAPHGGCGGGAAQVAPAAGMALPAPGIATAIPAGAFQVGMGAFPMPAPERFASSMAGGVILGSDGVPAGRIPAGSFLDTRDGTVYGPDGKQITIPEGAKVDFFELPDLAELQAMAKATTAFAGGAATVGMAMPAPKGAETATATAQHAHDTIQSFVDGQWGPGGITPIKGGGATDPAAGCDSAHYGGAPANAAATPATSATTPVSIAAKSTDSSVAGASGGGATDAAAAVAPASGQPFEAITAQIDALMAQILRLAPTPTSGGGPTLAAAKGADQLGSIEALRSSVNDLVAAIGELNVALANAGVKGSGPEQAPDKLPPPPPPPAPAPGKPAASTGSSTSVDDTVAPATDSSPS